MTPVVRLLGLDFADWDVEQAAAWLAARPAEAPFGYVVTPNADHLVRLARDPGLLAIYRAAALRLLDSRVVAGMSRLLGLAVPRVAPGSDLTAVLLARHIRPGERVTIIGLPADAVPGLRRRFGFGEPMHHEPKQGFERDPAAFAAAVAFVEAHPARFTFLAVGSPRQERLAAALAAGGRATGIGLCVGASLDFLTARERRAPEWMRRVGLEWLFRLGHQPRRLYRRYLFHSPCVMWLLLRARLCRRADRI